MVRKYLVITILTILLFGTISNFLVSYNYSGNGSFSSSYNSAFAAKAQKKTGNDVISTIGSENPKMIKQQEKVAQLSHEARDARFEAKLAQGAANNATENAQSLQAAALEADRKVTKLQFSAEKGSKNKDLLAAVLTDANEKHHAASMAEINAKALSDKSNSLNKAADKAEKLAMRAQKQLEISAKNSNNLGSDTIGQEKVSTDMEDQNSESPKDGLSLKNSKDESSQRINSITDGSQNNKSTESSPIRQQSISSATTNNNENTSIIADKLLGNEKRIQSGASADTDREISKSNSDSTNTGVGENSNTRTSTSTDNNTNTNTNTNDRGLKRQSQMGTSIDLEQLLAKVEQNAHSANTKETVNSTGPISPEANKSAAVDANSISDLNALDINSTDSLNTQSLTPGNSSSSRNTSVSVVDSSPFQSENLTTLNGSIQTGNDTVRENKNTTTSNSTDTGNSTMNIIQAGLPGNNSSVLSAVNSTGPIQEDAICDIAIDNSTRSLPSSSGFNMSENKQDDGGCYPNSSTSGQFKYLVWSEGDEDNRFILFKRSTDGGKTFDNAITLSGSVPSAVFNPKLSSEGNNVFVVWQGDSNLGNQDILMRKSTDNGKTFGSIVNLSNDHAGSGNPEINANASSVYVVWDGTTPGNNEIFYRRSLNNGSNFDTVRNLSNNGGVSYEPKVVVIKNALEVYWHDYKNGHEDILVKKSINEGKTFDVLQKISKDVLGLWKDRGGLDLRLNR